MSAMKNGILTLKVIGRKSSKVPDKELLRKIGSGLCEYFWEDGKKYMRIFRKDGKIVKLSLPDLDPERCFECGRRFDGK